MNCGLEIWPDLFNHQCTGKFFQPIRVAPYGIVEETFTQDQVDERIRTALRDLIDERDSLLDDLDSALDEVDELRADLDAVCGDLKLLTEKNQEEEPAFVGGANLFEYKIINRFSCRGYQYVVTLNGHIYEIVEYNDKDNIMYSLVAKL
jgi:hypothetical protein